MAVTLLLVVLVPQVMLPPVARFLDVSEPPAAVDYVLVLNGDPGPGRSPPPRW
jgi:hypothetical protein